HPLFNNSTQKLEDQSCSANVWFDRFLECIRKRELHNCDSGLQSYADHPSSFGDYIFGKYRFDTDFLSFPIPGIDDFQRLAIAFTYKLMKFGCRVQRDTIDRNDDIASL